MPRKNRGYKRGEPFRDSILFVIACEGAVREKQYFQHLAKYSSQIRVKVLENKDNNSAPRWLLDSAARYVEEMPLMKDDQLWFVMDVDRWPDEHLHSINQACENQRSWFLAISNPCFEVWLYMHVDDIANSTSNNCSELKAELPTKIQGGYNVVKFVPLLRQAYNRSLALENNPGHFIPEKMRTKMHLLTAELLKIVGLNSGL